QRAMVASDLAILLEVDAKHRQKQGSKIDSDLAANLQRSPGRSAEKAATELKVSPRSVAHAATVKAKGSPELVAAVRSGEVAVSKAAKVAKTTPKEKQLAAAKG